MQQCRRADGVRAALYWTGALEATAPAGTDCSKLDWTCEGGVSVGIGAYSGALGLTPMRSPNTDHAPYEGAPEISSWLAAP